MRRGTKFVFFVLAVLAVPIAMLWRWLTFDEDYSYTARPDVQLILDSPEVQHLLNEEGANVTEREAYGTVRGIAEQIESFQHPERYAPKHIEFLNDFAVQPAEAVPEGSHARALKTSRAPCGRIPLPFSDIYAYFRITTGPMKNHQGWACMSGDFAPMPVAP